MTNHVHLLLTPPVEEACSLVMRDLGREYAAYFNRRYGRTGSLWERPFKSCLVDSATYVVACYRYIERNPVRARMVARPADYRWSSHAGNAGLREDRLLTPHAEYEALGADAGSRLRAYHDLLAQTQDPHSVDALREATEAGYPLVGERLRTMLEARGARLARGRPGPRTEIITDVVRN